jgi:hypothetical protein
MDRVCPLIAIATPSWGKVFRIAHLVSLKDLMLAGTLAGVEIGLALAGGSTSKRRPHGRNG